MVSITRKARKGGISRVAQGLMACLVVHFLCLAFSCSSINCPVQNTVELKFAIRQYDAEGLLVTDTLKDTLYVWTQRKDGNDTLRLNRCYDKSSFALPISYNHPEDVFVFYVIDANHNWTLDTVWVKKDDFPHFESVDCSAHFFHRLTAVRSTHRRIDTIMIDNPSVTYDPTVVNLGICFTH